MKQFEEKKILNQEKMPRESEPTTNESVFTLLALKDGLRLDGRKLEQYRSWNLTFGDDYGVVEAQLGKTRYVCYLIQLRNENKFLRIPFFPTEFS